MIEATVETPYPYGIQEGFDLRNSYILPCGTVFRQLAYFWQCPCE